MKKIFIESNSGKVCANYEKIDDSKSIVIIAHGYLSSKRSRTGSELARRLNNSGISTINIDLYGHGESEGDVRYLTVTKAVENVLAVYDYVKKQGFERIGLVGSSFSGIVSMISAMKREFDVLSLKCPTFNYRRLWEERLTKEELDEWKKNGFKKVFFDKDLHFEIYEDSMQYDMPNFVKPLKTPVLVIHGTVDKIVDPKFARELIDSISSEKELFMVEGAGHDFRDPEQFEKMISKSHKWLSEHLKY